MLKLKKTLQSGLKTRYTELKKIRAVLQHSEERFWSIIKGSIDMIFIVDADGLINYESPSVSGILGYAEGYFIGQSSFNLVHPDDIELVKKRFKLVVDRNEVILTEYKHFKADGTWTYLEAFALNLSDNPAVKGIVITAREITKRKLAEEALRLSEEKFRNIFFNMNIGYVRIGLDDNFYDINPACLRIFGFSSIEEVNELVGSDRSCIFADTDEWDHIRMDIQNANYPIVKNLQMKRKDGTEFTCSFNLKIIRRDDGSPFYIEALIEDITEAIKTREILIQAEKMRTLAGLAAGMAHEINNPLGIIIHGAELAINRLVKDNAVNRKAAESAGIELDKVRAYIDARGIGNCLASIIDAGNRAASIVNNMLQFSRGGESKHDSRQLNTLIENALVFAKNEYYPRSRYDFNNIYIEKDYGNLPEILCSESQIEQVLFNILKNAAQAMNTVKYTEDKIPTIGIRTRAEHDYVKLEIYDNGPGMDENTRKRIFEPFYTTKKPGSGTGLGLSVSYYIIINGHGGTISVDSEPGSGTSFFITLPSRIARV